MRSGTLSWTIASRPAFRGTVQAVPSGLGRGAGQLYLGTLSGPGPRFVQPPIIGGLLAVGS